MGALRGTTEHQLSYQMETPDVTFVALGPKGYIGGFHLLRIFRGPSLAAGVATPTSGGTVSELDELLGVALTFSFESLDESLSVVLVSLESLLPFSAGGLGRP